MRGDKRVRGKAQAWEIGKPGWHASGKPLFFFLLLFMLF